MPRVTVSVSASGDQPLIAAPGVGLFIRVLGIEISSVSAQTLVAVKSGASTILWSTVALNAANSRDGFPTDKENALDCNVNEALNCNNAGTTNVRFDIQYSIYGKPTLGY